MLFCQTVKVKPEMTAPAAAPPMRHTTSSPASTRWATRKKQPAPAAEKVALMRLVRHAYAPTRSTSAHTWLSSTNSGVPGGCGTPSTLAAVMNSPASHSVTVGASVIR